MENGADSYLHKKFKKQLSVEPKSSHHEREKKSIAGNVESSEEKRASSGECKVIHNHVGKDNNEIVPKQSTNQNSSIAALNSTFSKSSISVEKCVANIQSSNTCISYVVSNSQFRPSSFDTKTEQVNSTVSTSSILDNVSKPNYPKPEETVSQNIPERKDHLIEDLSERKPEDLPPLPDKASGGKYVCPYCNLVCSKPSVLQKHIRAHTNERPYPCNSCGFSFKTRSNLYKHCRSRTHANRVMGNRAQEINNDVVTDQPNEPRSPQSNNNNMNNDEKLYKSTQDLKSKPYKPRFHTHKQFSCSITKENVQEENMEETNFSSKQPDSDLLSHHINEIISKNNSIVHSNDPYLLKKRTNDAIFDNNNEYMQRQRTDLYSVNANTDEPLNLTNKNRKRCMSEVVEPVAQKSLIKELLLKNLNSDMQCPHCKMIFQTVTELELHKLRSCKGFVKPGAKYSRSSSVNVASILTQNKNAFDNIPYLQHTSFPLKSPGPFLGKTRLVESDKSKSFSFDDGLPTAFPIVPTSERFLLSPLTLQNDKEKKTPVKLFGGEVKITHKSGETKSFKIDGKDGDKFGSDGHYADIEYVEKLSENRVVKSGLQSGGTVLTNKTNYSKADPLSAAQDVIRVYENTSVSPSIDITNFGKSKFPFDIQTDLNEKNATDGVIRPQLDQSNFTVASPSYKYTNIMDFSQKAVKLLTPNLKQPNLAVPGVPAPNKFTFSSNITKEIKEDRIIDLEKFSNVSQNVKEPPKLLENFNQKPFESKLICTQAPNLYNPMNLFVNGKVVRYVPGIPGPVVTEEPIDMACNSNIISTNRSITKKPLPLSPLVKTVNYLDTVKESEVVEKSSRVLENLEVNTDLNFRVSEIKSPKICDKSPVKIAELKSPNFETKKFARPNSLALKPTTASLKQHHGLTPTMFNQILISPDTPRVAKKYAQQFLNGNYFSYLGLKSSTKSVYCTFNKTQPFYVPHFKKLSMYSEWRQQDTKTDKFYVSAYDSRQKPQRFTTAGKATADLVVHSSYKFIASESSNGEKSGDTQKSNTILGGYECNEDYTYIRGRGRGRYVCDQCGIRCKKPSMLKKHIRTHSNDRPYTCNHCNFSFKTKGNLTKHMKSKAHTKNYAASSSGSSTQQSGTQSSESDTEDSGMDSSDECTRREEHEAAYGLLSLSQKTSPNMNSQFGRHEADSPISTISLPNSEGPINVMNKEEIAQVSKTNYVKNKILDEKALSFNTSKSLKEVPTTSQEEDMYNISFYLGKTTRNRPLTYPYTTILPVVSQNKIVNESVDSVANKRQVDNEKEPKSIKQFHVIQKYAPHPLSPIKVKHSESVNNFQEKTLKNNSAFDNRTRPLIQNNEVQPKALSNIQPPLLKVNDAVLISDCQNVTDLRKRKLHLHENVYNKAKVQKNDEVMDLSKAAEKFPENNRNNKSPVDIEDDEEREQPRLASPHGLAVEQLKNVNNQIYNSLKKPIEIMMKSSNKYNVNEDEYSQNETSYKNSAYRESLKKNNGNVLVLAPHQNDVNINYVIQEQPLISSESPKPYQTVEYDNSAMETLADIATKQVKLEKNTLAKSVASEYLKLATKNEFSLSDSSRDHGVFGSSTKEVNELIVKPEGSKNCHICSKSFSKPSQLRLHMNIHYLERPFRCHSCSVSFRTKGHLQKHERSASHHNKLSSSPALSSSEPRPFKCVDCNIAFRIHGHLAKHLRSKMHIMKLECLAKIPFGLYAELERSNSLLTEINTADGDQCLESLKTLAKKVFINEPNKLNQLNSVENVDTDS